MRVADLLALYALLGALLVFAARRTGALQRGRAVDHLLALLLWPLYVPALLRPPARPAAILGDPQRIPEEQQQLLAALDAVADPALLRLLPGRDALRRLFLHLATLQ